MRHKTTLFSTSVLSAVTSPEIRHYPNVLTEVFNHINEHEIQYIEFKISYIFTDTVALGYDVVKGTKYNILCLPLPEGQADTAWETFRTVNFPRNNIYQI